MILMAIFCATTGLKVISDPEWSGQKVSETLQANFSLIGDSIVYSRPKGKADLNGVKKSIEINDKVAKTAAGGNGPYIQIEDYSLIEGSSIEARKYFIKKVNDDPRRTSIIFCNTTLSSTIAIKLGRRFVNTNVNIQTVKSYQDAIELAMKLSQSELANINSVMLDIGKFFDKSSRSLFPVEFLSEESWDIQTEDYSCHSFIINQCILHSTNSGYFQTEHIPLVGQMLAECYSAGSIKYNIVDFSHFKGVHPTARIKHMKAMKNWFQKYPLKIYIPYNINASMKAVLYMAKPILPFKIRIAKDIQHALQIIDEDKRPNDVNASRQPLEKKSRQSTTVSQKDIENLASLLGGMSWESDLKSDIDANIEVGERHSFYPLYQSIKLIREEIDGLFSERKQAEDTLIESEKKYRDLFENVSDFIYFHDLEGNFIETNLASKIESGYTKEELAGKNIKDILVIKSDHLFDQYMNDTLRVGKSEGLIKVATKDGKKRILEYRNSLVTDTMGPVGVRGCARDITEQKSAEKQVKTSLVEKELLLKEIHHRVKNNLQIISSLLKTQEKKIEDKQIAGMFKDSQDRIASMSLIHEQLYQCDNLANIDFGDYSRKLVKSLQQSYASTSGRIALNIEAQNVFLAVDEAIPCGLIINELVSNSLKYAFPGDSKGMISLTIKSINDNRVEINFADDGIGLPKDLKIENNDTFGLKLITNLVEHQLGGEIALNRDKGIEFIIKFNV
jgi:PAS domain S-box-containing protein